MRQVVVVVMWAIIKGTNSGIEKTLWFRYLMFTTVFEFRYERAPCLTQREHRRTHLIKMLSRC